MNRKIKILLIFFVAVVAVAFWPTKKAQAFNLARFDSQSVPSSVYVGQTFNVSVTLTNTGTDTWTCCSGNAYRLGVENAAYDHWGLIRVDVSGSVATSQQYTFTFTATAPATAGTYGFQWR